MMCFQESAHACWPYRYRRLRSLFFVIVVFFLETTILLYIISHPLSLYALAATRSQEMHASFKRNRQRCWELHI